MDADVIDRIKRFLYENAYFTGKGDIDWILDQMCERPDWKVRILSAYMDFNEQEQITI